MSLYKQFSNPIENNAFSFELIFLDTVKLINFNRHVEIKELLKQNRIVPAQFMSHFLYLTVEAIMINFPLIAKKMRIISTYIYQNQKMLFGNEAK